MDREGLPPDGVRPFAVLAQALPPLGLCVRGAFHLTDADGIGPGTLVLIGLVGGALWAVAPQSFRAERDPLDAWTRRTLDPLAAACGARVLYPFCGPPFYPFQSWLRRALGLHPTPLGLLIDPVYGLWHAVRAAFIVPDLWPLEERPPHDSPCASCPDKPCLTVCPAQAVTAEGPHPDRCWTELSGPDRAGCKGAGCAARTVCPVGRQHRYPPAQQVFHQRAFLRMKPP